MENGPGYWRLRNTDATEASNREHHPVGADGSMRKEAGVWGEMTVKLTKRRMRFPRGLMIDNPKNHCPVYPVSTFSKIIGQVCPEKIC